LPTPEGPLTKNYVRISLEGDVPRTLDIYEYYWAHLTEKQASLEEVENWLQQTLAGAQCFWDENKELQETYEQREAGNSNSEAYWSKLNHLLKYGVYAYRSLVMLRRLIPNTGIFRSVTNALSGKASQLITDFVGDVAIYTTTDAKSENHAIRKQILRGAVTLAEALVMHPRYGQVVMCGHSLGSVIAFDTLNKLNVKANVQDRLRQQAHKMRGLITFGSPLDKIAFFFRQQAGDNQYVRRQMVNNLYSFKTRKWHLEEGEVKKNPLLESPIKPYFDHVKWLNFYHETDPVSGYLDFYKVDQNIKRVFQQPEANRWGFSHVGYWDDAPMYREIIKEFL
jgi:hypothetical protein